MLDKVGIQVNTVAFCRSDDLMGLFDRYKLVTRRMNQQNWDMSRLLSSLCQLFQAFEASDGVSNKGMPKTQPEDYIAHSNNSPRYNGEYSAYPLKEWFPRRGSLRETIVDNVLHDIACTGIRAISDDRGNSGM